MQTIDDRRVSFGEFAGPLAHGASFFDWQLISTQEVAAAFEYSFAEILADDGIPYAPVVVSTSVDRYPRIGEAISVETVPRSVGDSSVELLYEIDGDDGERLATARMTHVTIGSDGTALALPEDVRAAFADACVDRAPAVGPEDAGTDADDELASFSSTFEIRSPHIEGAELAYFEEYPRFADVALECHLEDCETSLLELRNEKEPYRIRDWRWEFKAPVAFGTTLRVDCEVLEASTETLRVAHELSSDGRTNIEGITEYGCFDRSGAPARFDEAMLEPFRT
ncbi:acyl-CoA thioesterase [Natronococcus occultus]|uniref:Putative thioesterase n=1 Tax=Natronococcus occultus SP4 TaxID=694430 RepID=L0K219_9EURY|nr:acyl-[acyl-carrier-protein] thioesterase [Natronococcus occultus]AGB38605.1 putative thioesterase [Natronococcus occultus SP4]